MIKILNYIIEMLNNAYNIEISDKLNNEELEKLKIIKKDLSELYVIINHRQLKD